MQSVTIAEEVTIINTHKNEANSNFESNVSTPHIIKDENISSVVSPRRKKHKRSKSTDRTKRRKKKTRKSSTPKVDKDQEKQRASLATLGKLSKSEFELLTVQFKSLDVDNTGNVTMDQFRASLGLLGNPQGPQSDAFVQLIFNSFDEKRDGYLLFPDFLEVMSILLKGTKEQKLDFAFALCDADRDNLISKMDLNNVIGVMYGILQKNDISIPSEPYKIAEEIFSKMDENGDGYVSKEEYRVLAINNPALLQGLGLYKPGKNEINFDLPTSGVTVTFGHANWGLMLNIMIGIRLSIPAAEALPKILLPKHYSERQKTSLQGNFTFDIAILDKLGFANEKMEENEFINYAPIVFKNVREINNITESSYMLSLGPEQLLGNMLCGNLASMKCKVSDGKSGSFFFSSHDGKYLVKTIYHREKNSFERILPQYVEFVSSNPNTLLNRIFGFHRIGMIPFIVLRNVFATLLPLHEVYDLKGSEWGRTNTEGHGVLKDLDFKQKLDFPENIKHAFLEQIRKDSEFLENHQLIDYSLLVGIHWVDRHNKDEDLRDKPLNPTLFTKYHGGIRSADGKKVYFVAIIDYLTLYGIRKTAESIIRSTLLQQQRDKISTVPPPQYAERFRRYISSIF